VLLEPYYNVRVIVPEEYMGDIIGDLNSKRGRVGGMDSAGTMRVVTAEVPLAEMQHYTIDLRSITGGRGTFSMEYSHYEQVPPQETQKIVADAASAEEDS
jgi:elongation factor G